MMLKNDPSRWGAVQQLLHWTTVALILVMAYLGLTMTELPNGIDKIKTYALHKSIGLTILGLVTLRLLWRMYAGAPKPVPGMPTWQKRAADVSHLALYLLLFAIPLSGWVLNSAAGFPLQWFGLVRLPHIVGKNHDLHETAEDVHEILFWILVTVVVVHAAAAFYHHLFQRDATLARMLPKGWLRAGDAPASTTKDSRDAA